MPTINILNISVYLLVLNIFLARTSKMLSVNKIKEMRNEKEVSGIVMAIINNCFSIQSRNIIIYEKKSITFFPMLNQTSSLVMSIKNDISSQSSINGTMISNIYSYDDVIVNNKNSPVKSFVIIVSTTTMLSLALKKLKDSIWWNHEVTLLLVNTELSVDGCSDAHEFLYLVWIFNILSALFICSSNKHGVQLYTFDPFSNFAPSPWNSVKIENFNNKYNSWTLFRYSLIQIPYMDSSLCQKLYYDKTQDLHGHVVNLGAFIQPATLSLDDTKVGLARFGGVNGKIAKEIWTKINVNASVKFYTTMGTFDANSNPEGFYEDLRLQKIDYVMNMIFFRYFWKLQTYPHESSAICIISFKDRSTVGFLRELLSTFTSTFWIIVAIISVILNVALKFLLNENLSSSCLELLRMIISVSSLKEPQQYSRRFFFAYIIVLTMMTNFYFQSSLSSISIAPKSKPVIDSEESLLKSDLIIYGRASMRSFLNLSNPKHKKRYVNEEFSKCAKRLLQGQRVACISGCISSRYSIYEGGKIHISEEKRHTFMSFAVRENWPLYFRVNQILRRISEAGLISLFRQREMRQFKRSPYRFQKPKQIITMRDVNFAFYVWNVGIVVSSCIFIFEMCFIKIKTKISIIF